jgi:hypothetical protein
LWEKTIKGGNGEPITIFYGSKIVQNETFLFGADACQESIDDRQFESPFKHFEPKKKKTGIFIDRFFHKWSYKDLAVKYQIPVSQVRSAYHAGKQRLLEVIAALDSSKPIKLDHFREQIAKRSGSLPNGQRWYLLNKLFGLTPAEIAKFEDIKTSKPVYKAIKYVSDRIEAGELDLFQIDPRRGRASQSPP